MIATTIFVWHLIVDFLIVLGIGGIMAHVLRQYLGRQPVRRYSDKQGGHTKHRREWNTRTVPGLRQYYASGSADNVYTRLPNSFLPMRQSLFYFYLAHGLRQLTRDVKNDARTLNFISDVTLHNHGNTG